MYYRDLFCMVEKLLTSGVGIGYFCAGWELSETNKRSIVADTKRSVNQTFRPADCILLPTFCHSDTLSHSLFMVDRVAAKPWHSNTLRRGEPASYHANSAGLRMSFLFACAIDEMSQGKSDEFQIDSPLNHSNSWNRFFKFDHFLLIAFSTLLIHRHRFFYFTFFFSVDLNKNNYLLIESVYRKVLGKFWL